MGIYTCPLFLTGNVIRDRSSGQPLMPMPRPTCPDHLLWDGGILSGCLSHTKNTEVVRASGSRPRCPDHLQHGGGLGMWVVLLLGLTGTKIYRKSSPEGGRPRCPDHLHAGACWRWSGHLGRDPDARTTSVILVCERQNRDIPPPHRRWSGHLSLGMSMRGYIATGRE